MILLTGMSGTGKSTVLKSLSERGFRAVDTDSGGWIDEPDGTERRWLEDRIAALLAAHERSGEALFVAGTVWNQYVFYERFDYVVLLSAPVEVMLERIAARESNPFGKTAEERERIIADTAEVVPMLRAAATVEIDTSTAHLDDIVGRLVEISGIPNGRRRRGPRPTP
ncbi:dephospho-CoA kinase [Nocardia sp. NPDC004068]|uniref:dephospho-CoA kinase n=1 Tax=Nocardia sp. NPDC004068 TaxID=3364303 RepID=UPI00369F6CDE